MTKGRIEAFSDGVIAIIITIMVLELHAPHGADWAALRELIPTFGSYVLSFVYVAIYCNNHHHLFHAVQRIDGAVMWANMHLLFWLSLTPFASAWLGHSGYATLPVAVYGGVLLLSAIAYTILIYTLLCLHGRDSALARAIGSDLKGKVSLALYVTAMICAFYLPALSMALYALVAAIWLVPDRRMEHAIAAKGAGHG